MSLWQLAKPKRQQLNKSEVMFWICLKGTKYNFRRQNVIQNYIVDFVSYSLKIIVEVDGIPHERKIKYDKFRDEVLIKEGFKIIHFVGGLNKVNDFIKEWIWNQIFELYNSNMEVRYVELV